MNSEQTTVSASDALIVLKEDTKDHQVVVDEEALIGETPSIPEMNSAGDNQIKENGPKFPQSEPQNNEHTDETAFMEPANKRIKSESFECETQENVCLVVDEGNDYIEEIVTYDSIPKEKPEKNVEMDKQNSKLEIIQTFHNFVMSFDVQQLQDFEKEIKTKMNNLKKSNEKIPNETILLALSSGLRIIKENTSSKLEIDDESFGLIPFLMNFRLWILLMHIPFLHGFSEMVKKDVNSMLIRAEKERIPIGIIRQGLEATLSILIG